MNQDVRQIAQLYSASQEWEGDFNNKLCKNLITNSFYPITEFLEHSKN